MAYTVKEIFYSLQGEGAHTGRPAVFLRFAGCNLWSGRERDRMSAICQFCDTNFVGGKKYADPNELGTDVMGAWPDRSFTPPPFVVCTGGEPLLQLDQSLIEQLKRWCFEIAVETNGTILAPRGIDWLTVSPKAGADLVQTTGDELKLVYPQRGAEPEKYENMAFKHFYLQPMYGVEVEANTRAAIAYCLANPQWKLSLQTHKALGLQ